MEESLLQTIAKSIALLDLINSRIEKLEQHQFNYDLVGVGLTALSVILAIIAVGFMLNIRNIAKADAEKAANELLSSYLEDPERMSKLIEPWLDNNRTEIANNIYMASLVMGTSGLESDFGSAFDPDDLYDIPDDERD